MAISNDFEQELIAGNVTQAFALALSQATRLRITTWVAAPDADPLAVRLQTQINLLEGEVEHQIGAAALERNDYSNLKDFHLSQVHQAGTVVLDNLAALQKLWEVWTRIQVPGMLPGREEASIPSPAAAKPLVTEVESAFVPSPAPTELGDEAPAVTLAPAELGDVDEQGELTLPSEAFGFETVDLLINELDTMEIPFSSIGAELEALDQEQTAHGIEDLDPGEDTLSDLDSPGLVLSSPSHQTPPRGQSLMDLLTEPEEEESVPQAPGTAAEVLSGLRDESLGPLAVNNSTPSATAAANVSIEELLANLFSAPYPLATDSSPREAAVFEELTSFADADVFADSDFFESLADEIQAHSSQGEEKT